VALVRRTLEVVRDAVRRGEVRSAHDVAEGGFAVALAESCLAGGRGAQVDFRGVGPSGERLLELLFGEGAGGILLSGPRPALAAIAREVPLTMFGIVGGPGADLELSLDGDATLAWPLDELRTARERGLADAIG
jgi:phosphoribosylformylglycinamidine (FGAM) synthase-like enzyme